MEFCLMKRWWRNLRKRAMKIDPSWFEEVVRLLVQTTAPMEEEIGH